MSLRSSTLSRFDFIAQPWTDNVKRPAQAPRDTIAVMPSTSSAMCSQLSKIEVRVKDRWWLRQSSENKRHIQ